MLLKHKKHKQKRTYDLVAHTYPQSPLSEAFRTLRTNLGFADVDKRCRTIMVTSPNPRDGKSTIISNLAIVLAQAGKKVILVDADLRKPVQHRVFNLTNLKGFTNYLLDRVSLEEAVQQGPLPELTVLTSGPIPPNPAELLGSARTKNFWALLKKKYDYILVDSPPVLAVTDSLILAGQVDGVILVIKPGSTRNNIAAQVQEQFTRAGARLLGAVINKVKVNSLDYRYVYHYYYGNSSTN